ncbi:MAG: twin-arginine translocase TatA/TatE family subunit [Myroides sp.]|jgi:sec-independent protein translocase protein TatA|nr:twin-arginine translocase TatA/TatE family subunit [Myroides sp.]
MFSRFGATEIILIVVVILLLFGGKKIPELMKGLGSGIKEFKDATKDDSGATSNPKKNDTDTKSE